MDRHIYYAYNICIQMMHIQNYDMQIIYYVL
jgi:hypothetical protein